MKNYCSNMELATNGQSFKFSVGQWVYAQYPMNYMNLSENGIPLFSMICSINPTVGRIYFYNIVAIGNDLSIDNHRVLRYYVRRAYGSFVRHRLRIVPKLILQNHLSSKEINKRGKRGFIKPDLTLEGHPLTMSFKQINENKFYDTGIKLWDLRTWPWAALNLWSETHPLLLKGNTGRDRISHEITQVKKIFKETPINSRGIFIKSVMKLVCPVSINPDRKISKRKESSVVLQYMQSPPQQIVIDDPAMTTEEDPQLELPEEVVRPDKPERSYTRSASSLFYGEENYINGGFRGVNILLPSTINTSGLSNCLKLIDELECIRITESATNLQIHQTNRGLIVLSGIIRSERMTELLNRDVAAAGTVFIVNAGRPLPLFIIDSANVAPSGLKIRIELVVEDGSRGELTIDANEVVYQNIRDYIREYY